MAKEAELRWCVARQDPRPEDLDPVGTSQPDAAAAWTAACTAAAAVTDE